MKLNINTILYGIVYIDTDKRDCQFGMTRVPGVEFKPTSSCAQDTIFLWLSMYGMVLFNLHFSSVKVSLDNKII